jgi:hypothetical protein
MPTYVKTAPNVSFTNTCTFGSAVASGSWVVGMAVNYNAEAIFTITDNQSNNYPIVQNIVGLIAQVVVFAGGPITNGPTILTANTADNFPTIFASEYSGVSGLDGFRANEQENATGTDSLTSLAITTTVNGCKIWGGLICNDVAAVAGTGYTSRYVGTDGWFPVSEDRDQASAGSIAATFTPSAGATPTVAAVVALKPLAGPTAASRLGLAAGATVTDLASKLGFRFGVLPGALRYRGRLISSV